jgi:ABC-type nitrate/sulfonate/bicarbonate transport system permease component
MSTEAVQSARPARAAARGRARRPRRELVIGSASILVFLGLWQASGLWLNPIYFATPSSVARALGRLVSSGQLGGSAADTVLVLVLGLAIATAVGMTCGVLMGRSPRASRVLSPMVSFANASPAIALLPLMEIWFGVSVAARVAFVFVLCVFTLTLNTMAGVQNIPAAQLELGRNLGMSRFLSLRRIILPGAAPHILTGLRVGSAQALVGAVLAGQEVGQAGLGGLAQTFSTYFQTPELLVSVITSTCVGFAAFALIRLFERMRCPWIHDLGHGG